MKILLIDNNDSFTYNLLHLIKSVCRGDDSVEICNKDKLSSHMVSAFDRIIISPGPGIPADAKIIRHIVSKYEGNIPIFGICLGHQVIAERYGATTYNMKKPVHGIRSEITITDHDCLFRGMDCKIMAGRYHSWCVSSENIPDCLKITAIDGEGNIMALAHREYEVYGVQFHPESFMTDCGKSIMFNFLNNRQK